MVLMINREIPYRLNPIGAVSSLALRQAAAYLFYSLPRSPFLIILFPFYSCATAVLSFTAHLCNEYRIFPLIIPTFTQSCFRVQKYGE